VPQQARNRRRDRAAAARLPPAPHPREHGAATAPGFAPKSGVAIGDDELIERVRAYVPAVLHVTGTPGVSLALGRGGRVVWEEGFGYADLATRSPMTAESTAKVGSLSKLYTAIAVMQLVERGVLDLYRPVNDYVDAFSVINPLGERHVTIYDLLTFRSGLAIDTYESDSAPPGPLRDYLASQFETSWGREYGGNRARWLAKTGVEYQYSNLGVATLGYLVEATNPDGLTFPAYVRRHILEPLGMASSAFMAAEEDPDCLGEVSSRLSVGYARFDRTYIPTPLVHSAVSPAAGLVTTAGDYVRLLLAFLNDGAGVVSRETARFMLTPQLQADHYPELDDSWTGLMFQIANADRPDAFFGHGGSFPLGWYHESRGYPHHDLAIVGLTNKWDLIRWVNPPAELAPSLIAEFAVSLLAAGAGDRVDVASHSWEWKTAYVMGAMLVERCRGLFGIEASWPERAIKTMIAGTRTIDRGVVGNDWDPDGFSRGVADMMGTEMLPDAIRAFVESPEFAVPSAELPLVALAFGRRGALPMPMPYFARRAGWGAKPRPNDRG
jgi:CubicO group peptidase (beta-lactamase class C family)